MRGRVTAATAAVCEDGAEGVDVDMVGSVLQGRAVRVARSGELGM